MDEFESNHQGPIVKKKKEYAPLPWKVNKKEEFEKKLEKTASTKVIAQFVDENDNAAGPQLELPLDTSTKQLELLLNHLQENEDPVPYAFFLNESEIRETVNHTFHETNHSIETVLKIVFQPQAVFKVKPITRCTSSLQGHSESVISAQFSPDGNQLASGSGDTTVRFWDIQTETATHTCKGHSNWVLYVSWSPDGTRVASGGMDNVIRIWDYKTGKQLGAPLKGHTRYVTSIAWEPFHRNMGCSRLVSASKDCSLIIWDVKLSRRLFHLTSHTMSVTCVKWGGEGFIYSGSQDRSIKVWKDDDGSLANTLKGHAHWVNTLALNTDYVLRTGANDYTEKTYDTKKEAFEAAIKRYDEIKSSLNQKERLVSGSDDFTMMLWEPLSSKKPLQRMTGHTGLINMVAFSPNGKTIASASFDKSIKLWNGLDGKFIGNMRAHVEAVYQIAWSPDSRMLVSGSKDSTLLVWDVSTKKIKVQLPGHADEVYTVDWSPGADRVVSGSKDKLLKIWRN